MEYLVHWKGYPSHDDTWEPLANMANAMDLVHEYNTVFQIPQTPNIHMVHIINMGPTD
jgi:hypothetical protein